MAPSQPTKIPAAARTTEVPLTVTQLAEALNEVVAVAFSTVRFQGEIGEISRPASGHLYFTIKDAGSQLAGVMWRSSVTQLRFQPAPGMEVVCVGQPNVWAKSGRLQLIVRQMHEAGEGALQRKFLELKRKLEGEGLFDPARKRTLPQFPRSIGVVTSASGAVIHDIMARVKERLPSLPVFLCDVRVQGPGAAEEIAAAIRFFNDRHPVDVLIVGRGGGSLEDLWAFNEEVVVRAIFGSRIPVVSAVGHEVDVTLSDLVADLRAPTPTAAAELLVPSRVELLRQLAELERRIADTDRWLQPKHQALDELLGQLTRRVDLDLADARGAVQTISLRLAALEPSRLIELLAERLQQSQVRIERAAERILSDRRSRLEQVATRIDRLGLFDHVLRNRERITELRSRFARATAERMRRANDRVSQLGEALQALDPKRVLERGYAVVRSAGAVVRDGRQLASGERIEVQLARDVVMAEVIETRVSESHVKETHVLTTRGAESVNRNDQDK
jgi:exodeoxyribonuclease VII large subunit